jgi:hypothetical protein
MSFVLVENVKSVYTDCYTDCKRGIEFLLGAIDPVSRTAEGGLGDRLLRLWKSHTMAHMGILSLAIVR